MAALRSGRDVHLCGRDRDNGASRCAICEGSKAVDNSEVESVGADVAVVGGVGDLTSARSDCAVGRLSQDLNGPGVPRVGVDPIRSEGRRSAEAGRERGACVRRGGVDRAGRNRERDVGGRSQRTCVTRGDASRVGACSRGSARDGTRRAVDGKTRRQANRGVGEDVTVGVATRNGDRHSLGTLNSKGRGC